MRPDGYEHHTCRPPEPVVDGVAAPAWRCPACGAVHEAEIHEVWEGASSVPMLIGTWQRVRPARAPERTLFDRCELGDSSEP